jgi:hypothetical protein
VKWDGKDCVRLERRKSLLAQILAFPLAAWGFQVLHALIVFFSYVILTPPQGLMYDSQLYLNNLHFDMKIDKIRVTQSRSPSLTSLLSAN